MPVEARALASGALLEAAEDVVIGVSLAKSGKIRTLPRKLHGKATAEPSAVGLAVKPV